MFIYKINRWLDQYDPYWHNRYSSFKVGYILIIMFTANMLCRPDNPIFFLLLGPWGINSVEGPSTNRYRRKDFILVNFFLLTGLSVVFFSLIIYYRAVFVVAGGVYCFALYYVINNYWSWLKGTVVYALITALIAVANNFAGDFYLALNELLTILVTGIIVFWAYKFFPNFYYYKWQSAVARSLEQIITAIKARQVSAKQISQFMQSYHQVNQILPLLVNLKACYSYFRFSRLLIQYCYWLSALHDYTGSEIELGIAADDIQALSHAIIKMQPFNYVAHKVMEDELPYLQFHYQLLHQLSIIWNRICGRI